MVLSSVLRMYACLHLKEDKTAVHNAGNPRYDWDRLPLEHENFQAKQNPEQKIYIQLNARPMTSSTLLSLTSFALTASTRQCGVVKKKKEKKRGVAPPSLLNHSCKPSQIRCDRLVEFELEGGGARMAVGG